MRYDAFISYRHGADAVVAAAIERGLERLARPWHRLRAMSVFRDESDLAAESDLSGAITRTLDDSRFFVLIASPESAASPWVDKEVAHWCNQGNGLEQLIVVVTDGEFEWNETAGALTPSTNAVSSTVRSRFTTEPLFVDLRWARQTSELSLRESRFRTAIVLIAATIRGIAPADLESEDVRLHRRARRLARGAVATVLVLALVASIAAVVAVANARRAERRARDALGRQLGLAALDMPASEVDQAFLLSLVAANLDSGSDAERFRASRALIGRYSRLETLLYAPAGTTSLRSVAISVDGVVSATTTQDDGTTALFTWPAGITSEAPTVTSLPGAIGVAPSISFLDGGRLWVGGSTSSGLVTIDGNGTEVTTFPDTVALDIHSRVLAERTPAGGIELSDLDDGALLARVDDVDARLVDLQYRRLATASDDEIVALDAERGTAARVDIPSGWDVTAIAAGPSTEVAAVTASLDGIVPWSWHGDALRAGDSVPLPTGVGRPEHVAIAPDGARVVVVGAAGSAIFNVVRGVTEAVDQGATGRVVVDPSGRFAAVGGGRLTVWDLVTGAPTFAVPLPVNAMTWSGSCAETPCKLVTAGQSLDAWDPATRRRVPLVDQTNAQAVAISADGDTVVTAGWGSTVAVWQLRPRVDNSGRSVASDVTARGSSQCDLTSGEDHLEAMSPDGTLVARFRPGDQDVNTTVCRANDGSVVATGRVAPFSSPPESVAVDNGGNLVVGGGGGFVARYPRDGDAFPIYRGVDVRLGSGPVEVTSLAYHADTIVAGLRPADEAAAARVFVWPITGGGEPGHFEIDYLEVPAIALLGADAGHMMVAGRDRPGGAVTLQIWETLTRVRVGRALGGLSGEVIALGGDDTAVFALDAGGTAYRWELDRDPTSDICGIVGRPLSRDEWDTLEDGVLRPYNLPEICAESTRPRPASAVPTVG